jgi:hypothetical protein
LIWFGVRQPRRGQGNLALKQTSAPVIPSPERLRSSHTFSRADIGGWSVNGLLCGAFIGLEDQSLFSAAVWMAVALGLGFVIMPWLERWAKQLDWQDNEFWLTDNCAANETAHI